MCLLEKMLKRQKYLMSTSCQEPVKELSLLCPCCLRRFNLYTVFGEFCGTHSIQSSLYGTTVLFKLSNFSFTTHVVRMISASNGALSTFGFTLKLSNFSNPVFYASTTSGLFMSFALSLTDAGASAAVFIGCLILDIRSLWFRRNHRMDS